MWGGVTSNSITTQYININKQLNVNCAYVSGSAYGLWELPQLTAGTDLNELLTPRMYGIQNNNIAANIKNIPIQSAGILRVYNAVGELKIRGNYIYLKQEFYPFHSVIAYGRTIMTNGDENAYNYGEWVKMY